MKNPKITIITCTLNSEKYLKETINSVKNQNYQNFEHLFIDGGSTDNTISIIKNEYQNPRLITGKDESLYDAFNKGLHNAKGRIIGFLNSDDTLTDKHCLTRIINAFKDNPIDYYCSRMKIFDAKLKNQFSILGQNPHKPTFKDQLFSSTYFAHPTYYCKKEIINKVGEYDLNYKVASDIDWLYRLEKMTKNFYFDPTPLINFRGEVGMAARKCFTGLKEEFLIRQKYEKLSLHLTIIYCYHFLRRTIRYILEKLKLKKIINLSRKIIIKLAP